MIEFLTSTSLPRGANLLTSDVTRKHFERLVTKAVRSIPKRFRDAMNNVAVVVEDQPSPELLKKMGVVPPDTLYGLYQGTPSPGTGVDSRQRATRPDHDLPTTDR